MSIEQCGRVHVWMVVYDFSLNASEKVKDRK